MDFITSPAFVVVGVVAIAGWVFTTWLRVKHGYPLEGSFGQALKPVQTNEQIERLKLLGVSPGLRPPRWCTSRT